MLNLGRLIERWQLHGIPRPAGVAITAIQAFECGHNVVLPADMRAYFLAVNGMGERETWDDDFFRFWPLQELVTIAEELPDRSAGFTDANRCFMFADYSIGLPTFAIRLSADETALTPVASVFSDGGAFKVQYFFGSFTDFVTGYLDDPVKNCCLLPDCWVADGLPPIASRPR